MCAAPNDQFGGVSRGVLKIGLVLWSVTLAPDDRVLCARPLSAGLFFFFSFLFLFL